MRPGCRIASEPAQMLATFALGSCIGLSLYDSTSRIAGMLHFMLPDSGLASERARLQPAAFADTGIPLLFRAAYTLGAQKKHCVVRLVGGAELAGPRPEGVEGIFNVGRRNILAARGVLWRNGIMISGEEVGGTEARTIAMAVADGRVAVKTGGSLVAEL